MESITIQLGALLGTAAILLRNHAPTLKSILAAAVSKYSAGSSAASVVSSVDDIGCVVAFNALRGRLSAETAKTVWAEIEPKGSEA
jgi:hypothetical protein